MINERAKPSALFIRSVESMYDAMRITTANSRTQLTRQQLRAQIPDLSSQFLSANDAIEFAIAYMKCALGVPRYHVPQWSRAYFEMRCWLPYCVEPVDEKLHILVGRDYKPAGMVQEDARVDYARFPQLQLSMSERQRDLHATADPRYGSGYLYIAGPWTCRFVAQKYLDQLVRLKRR